MKRPSTALKASLTRLKPAKVPKLIFAILDRDPTAEENIARYDGKYWRATARDAVGEAFLRDEMESQSLEYGYSQLILITPAGKEWSDQA